MTRVVLRVRFHLSRELAPGEWGPLRADPNIAWTCPDELVVQAISEIDDTPQSQTAAVRHMYQLLDATRLHAHEYGPEAIELEPSRA